MSDFISYAESRKFSYLPHRHTNTSSDHGGLTPLSAYSAVLSPYGI
jgi:hypothetical protein